MVSRLVILTGASGSGKTTIAKTIAAQYSSDARVFFFDSIGVPSDEEMVAMSLHPHDWQYLSTVKWMQTLAGELRGNCNILFEGQMRIAFIEEALKLAEISEYAIILVDCDDELRIARLTHERHQPHLATEDMIRWARYLRDEARERGYPILDTSRISLEESVAYVCNEFHRVTDDQA